MIDNKLSFINGTDDKTFVESESEDSLVKYYKCPKCGSYHIVRNGTYTRKTHIDSKDIKITKIQKYFCKDCNTSFKYLPLYLTSYSHLTTLTLFKVLIDKASLNSLSKLYNLSRSSLRHIKERFIAETNKITFILKTESIKSFKELLKSYFEGFNHFLFSSSTTLANYHFLVSQLS